MGMIVNKEKRLSNSIDNTLQDHKLKVSRIIRILLLGSGQSGKSTIVKQMRIYNEHPFSLEEREYYRAIIRENIPDYVLTLLSAMKTLRLTFNDYSLQRDADQLLDHLQCGEDFEYTPESAESIQMLWSNPGMLKCYNMRNQFNLPDSAKHFLDSIGRITDEHYIPSNEDILYTRVPTTGIAEITFNFGKHEFHVVDVGGQKSERRKWIHCFDNVSTLIFLTAISDYDLVLEEDGTKNRIHDSLELYEAITNSDFFVNKNIILFLNKIDLFKEKITNVPLAVAFPMYKGLQSYETGIFFIRNRFEQRINRNKERKIKVHETCATDTAQVKVVIETVIRNITAQNQIQMGLF